MSDELRAFAHHSLLITHYSSLITQHFLSFLARGSAERHAADYLQLEAFERRHLRGVVREQEYAPEAQLVEYLRADAVVPVFAVAGLDAGLVLRQALLAHELVRAELVDEVEVVVALAQIEYDAAPRRRDALKGGVQLESRVVYERAEHVAGHVLGVDAHEHRLGPHNVV